MVRRALGKINGCPRANACSIPPPGFPGGGLFVSSLVHVHATTQELFLKVTHQVSHTISGLSIVLGLPFLAVFEKWAHGVSE
jgi:hypothetical protein